ARLARQVPRSHTLQDQGREDRLWGLRTAGARSRLKTASSIIIISILLAIAAPLQNPHQLMLNSRLSACLKQFYDATPGPFALPARSRPARTTYQATSITSAMLRITQCAGTGEQPGGSKQHQLVLDPVGYEIPKDQLAMLRPEELLREASLLPPDANTSGVDNFQNNVPHMPHREGSTASQSQPGGPAGPVADQVIYDEVVAAQSPTYADGSTVYSGTYDRLAPAVPTLSAAAASRPEGQLGPERPQLKPRVCTAGRAAAAAAGEGCTFAAAASPAEIVRWRSSEHLVAHQSAMAIQMKEPYSTGTGISPAGSGRAAATRPDQGVGPPPPVTRSSKTQYFAIHIGYVGAISLPHEAAGRGRFAPQMSASASRAQAASGGSEPEQPRQAAHAEPNHDRRPSTATAEEYWVTSSGDSMSHSIRLTTCWAGQLTVAELMLWSMKHRHSQRPTATAPGPPPQGAPMRA
uniref:Uncharacterized protein n=1 Tax=Macrostomum lignano TaxID=282301 RepID=A0A1I8FMI9_9PLAT